MGFDEEMTIGRPVLPTDPEVMEALEREVGGCPDVAFAHLPEVFVPGRQERPEKVLFVWLDPGALGSLQSALDLVSAAVSRALPQGDYIDVVVLNSAPELLEMVEGAGCLLVERSPDERRRAIEAARNPPPEPVAPNRGRWWSFRSSR